MTSLENTNDTVTDMTTDNTLHPLMDSTLISQDENGICAETMEDTAEAAALEMYDAPCWIDSVKVYRIPDYALKDEYESKHYTEILTDAAAEDIDEYLISEFSGHIDAPEPKCEHPEHDSCNWEMDQIGCKENPGVIGHGGGVKIYEHCANCDRTKVLNTWASHPETGEQGFKVTSYGHRDEIL